MSELFLFADTLKEKSGSCVGVINGKLDPSLPLGHRTFNEIALINLSWPIVLVLAQTQCCLYQVKLPWISEKKARLALPYALEEQIAQPLDRVHLAFNKMFYKNSQYLVLGCSRNTLTKTLRTLEQANIHPKQCTSDWFALNALEAALHSNYAILHNSDFKGSLPYPFLDYASEINALQIHAFRESPMLKGLKPIKHSDLSYYEWIAQRLSQKPCINLLQGIYAPKSQSSKIKKLYKIAFALGLLWFISFFALNGLKWYQYQKKNKELSAEIKHIYQGFFPQATQVINPKFRIGLLLKQNGKDQLSPWWKYLQAMLKSIDGKAITIHSLRYQNLTATVHLTAKSFNDLETFQDKLNRFGIQIRQSNATMDQQSVAANLELTL